MFEFNVELTMKINVSTVIPLGLAIEKSVSK